MIHALEVEAALAALESRLDGLRGDEVAERLALHGPNQLPEVTRSAWAIVRRQLDDVLVWVLFGALGLSIALPFLEHGARPGAGAFVDASVIAVILLLNAALGVVQEYRAERAVAALKRLSAPSVVVRREGIQQVVPGKEVVPGDVLVLETGDRVAADARVLSCRELAVDESMLTGESLPTAKDPAPVAPDAVLGDRACMVHQGTLLTSGSAVAVVTSTGTHTASGQIARLLGAAKTPDTPLQRQLATLSRALGVGALGVCGMVMLLGWFRSMPAIELVLVGISLAVSAVPEGLPAVVTVCFALGMRRMAEQQAIVRRLDALETLGAVTVVATDKTGTLTANRMEVVDHALAPGADLTLLAEIGLSCNRAVEAAGDPTEQALLVFGRRAEVERVPIDEEIVPFSSERRFMSTRHGERRFWKGAPERLLELAGPSAHHDGLAAAAEAMASRGLRVLAGGVGPPDALRLVGIWGLEDPPREGVIEAIASASRAGIRTVMVSGDHLATAANIARRVGIGGEAMEGRALDGLSESEIEALVQRVGVFGRVSPEHKVAICRALQAGGEVVAMTGDGVNDGPALKAAHVGVAMGRRGTDVAREAAAIVLADDHYATIVAAVAEGRRMHDNIRRFVLFLLRANVDEVLLIGIALLLGFPLPYLPAHILWLNLLTDGPLAIALAAEPAEPDVMERPPRPPTESLLTGEWARLAIYAGTATALTLAVFVALLRAGEPVAVARTATLTLALVLELALAFSARSRHPLWTLPVSGNPWLLVGAVAIVLIHAVALVSPLGGLLQLTPLPAHVWFPLGGAAAVGLAVFELSKLLIRRGPSPTQRVPAPVR